MEMVKLGKKGQLSIPKSVLRRVGIEGEVPLLIDTTADGAIILRPAGVYPIELYSDERLQEFAEEDRMAPAAARKMNSLLKRARPAG
jgi:AbrB family looped-hinge helix DNA binding protein